MDSLILIGIGNLMVLLVIFTFTLMHLRDINDKTQLSINGISHVWGALTELGLKIEGEEE